MKLDTYLFFGRLSGMVKGPLFGIHVTLSPDEFRRAVDVIAHRDDDPHPFELLKSEAIWSEALRVWEANIAYTRKFWLDNLRRMPSEQWRRYPPGRNLRKYARSGGTRGGARSCAMALALGEIKRVARGGRVEGDAALELKAGEEAHLVGLYPVLSIVGGELATRKTSGGELPVDMVLDTVEEIEVIQGSIGKEVLAHTGIGLGTLPLWAKGLAAAGNLTPEDLADCFQMAYDNRWHTKPKTKTARGAFVEGIRDRAVVDGTPGLLTVLAAGSDGSLRSVAGGSERTPAKVYERMIFDNSFAVLRHVVANKHFDDNKAYAMIEKDLPMQLASVMLHGRVHIGVKVLACKKAIGNAAVDPYKIYRFLVDSRTNEAVPEALWKDFVSTLQVRLKALEDRGEVEAAGRVRERLARVTTDFVTTVLRPYAEAVIAIGKLDAKAAERPPSQRGNYSTYYENRARAEHKQFVTANEFLKHPAVMDLVTSGARDPKLLLIVLEAVLQAKLPVSKALVVRVMKHDDVTVRQAGLKLLPQYSESDVERLSKELDQQIVDEYTALEAEVRNVVIPNYEEIDAEARVVSRMHYHFQAAKVLTGEQLIAAFVEAARTDPTKIPDEFRRRTEAARASVGEPQGRLFGN